MIIFRKFLLFELPPFEEYCRCYRGFGKCNAFWSIVLPLRFQHNGYSRIRNLVKIRSKSGGRSTRMHCIFQNKPR